MNQVKPNTSRRDFLIAAGSLLMGGCSTIRRDDELFIEASLSQIRTPNGLDQRYAYMIMEYLKGVDPAKRKAIEKLIAGNEILMTDIENAADKYESQIKSTAVSALNEFTQFIAAPPRDGRDFRVELENRLQALVNTTVGRPGEKNWVVRQIKDRQEEILRTLPSMTAPGGQLTKEQQAEQSKLKTAYAINKLAVDAVNGADGADQAVNGAPPVVKIILPSKPGDAVRVALFPRAPAPAPAAPAASAP